MKHTNKRNHPSCSRPTPPIATRPSSAPAPPLLWPGACFAKLVPPLVDSFIRHKAVLELPASARTFGVEESFSTSRATEISAKKPDYFDLDEIDSQNIDPPKITSPSSSRMTSPPPAPKAKAPASSRKRKAASTSAQETSPFEGLNCDAILGKSSQFVLEGHEYLMKSLHDMNKEFADTKAKLEDVKKSALDKTKQLEKKLGKVETELKVVKSAQAKTMRDHQKEMEEYKQGLMKSATISVFQARVRMALQAKDPNFKMEDWDVEAWQEKILSLGGKEVASDFVPVADPQDAGKEAEMTEAEVMDAGVAKEFQVEDSVGNEGCDD